MRPIYAKIAFLSYYNRLTFCLALAFFKLIVNYREIKMVKPPQNKTLLKIKLCNSLKNNMDCLNNKIQNSTNQLDMVLKFFQYVIGEMKQTNLDDFFAKQPTVEENLTLFNELVSSFLNEFSTLATRDEQMLEFMTKAKEESPVSKLNGKLENMSLDDLVIDAAKYEPEFPSLPVKIEVKVTISFANSPSDFYVQAYSKVPEYIIQAQAATNDLIVKGIKCLPNMAPGMHCVARYSEDFYWYRAKIISINAGKVKVFFFDFGNAEEVDPTWIMPMAKSIAADKAMAVACHYAHYNPQGGWSQQAISAFKEKFKTNNVLKCLFYDEIPRISEFGTYPYYPVDIFLEDGSAFMNEIVAIDKKQKKSLKKLAIIF